MFTNIQEIKVTIALCRRADARNVSFNTKLQCYTLPLTQHHSFFRIYSWIIASCALDNFFLYLTLSLKRHVLLQKFPFHQGKCPQKI